MTIKSYAFAAMLLAMALVPFGGTSASAASNKSPGQQQASGTAVKNPGSNTPFPAGWNFVHVTNCYLDDSGNFYVYPQEGGYLYTSNWQFMNIIEPQCTAGNWIAFYVYDSYGDWSVIYTYNYR